MKDKHATPLSPAERAIISELLDVFKRETVPHGRAVYMFGAITASLVQYATAEHGVSTGQAIQDYLELFGAGLGVETEVRHETVATH